FDSEYSTAQDIITVLKEKLFDKTNIDFVRNDIWNSREKRER
ncbi:5082_t:CDS:1, partial [Cetraspora pellucida]